MNDELTRITHTHDDLEPFVYNGDTLRKRTDGFFEIWGIDHKASEAARSEHYDWIERRKESYEAALAQYKEDFSKLTWWQRVVKRVKITKPSDSHYSFRVEAVKGWEAVVEGPYFKKCDCKYNYGDDEKCDHLGEWQHGCSLCGYSFCKCKDKK